METPATPRRTLLIVATAALAACSSNDNPTVPGSIAVGLSASSATIVQGASTPLTATLTRTNFTGDVQLSAEGLPAGVSASFTPATLSGSVNSSAIVLAATTAAAPAVMSITVRATGSGLQDATSAVSLTVTAATAYTLTLANATASIAQGGSGTVNVALARTNFTAGVSLAVTGLPAGVTASFSPTPATGTTSVLTLSVGASAAPGTSNLTVTGSATGLTDRGAPLALTITPSGASTDIAYAYCGSNAPVWFAYQNGTSGAWTTVTPGPGNTYSFTLTSSVGGVASVQQVNGNTAAAGYATTINYGTAAELKGGGGTVCATPPTGKTVTGKVLGIGANEDAQIVLSGGFAQVDPLTNTTGEFALTRIASGAHDLIAARRTVTRVSVFEEYVSANKIILRRALDPAAGSALADLDFTSTGAAAASGTLTVTGLGGAQANVAVGFSTLNGSGATLTSTITSGGTATYSGVPSASLIAGDEHDFFIDASSLDESRFLFTYYRNVANRTIAMGPVMSTPTFATVATSPYTRVSASLASQAAYDGTLFLAYYQFHSETGVTPSDRYVQIVASAGYFGGTPATWTVVIPDLSGAAGFTNSWGLSSASATDYSVFAVGTAPTGAAPEGTTWAFAGRGGIFTSSPAMGTARTTLALGSSRLSREQRATLSQQTLRQVNPRLSRINPHDLRHR
jgi:hypothetical protein